VFLVDPRFGGEDRWLADMFRELDFLELLELGGDCGWVLRRLRRRMARSAMRVDIRTLIVRGGRYARSQAFKLESAKDDLGLQNMTMTYIRDPEAHKEFSRDPDTGSLSDDEARDEDSDSDSDDSDEDDGTSGFTACPKNSTDRFFQNNANGEHLERDLSIECPSQKATFVFLSHYYLSPFKLPTGSVSNDCHSNDSHSNPLQYKQLSGPKAFVKPAA